MAIYMTAQYAVRPEALERCLGAIREFVAAVGAHEPGTQLYVSLQEHQDHARFLHVFVFDDEAAEQLHRIRKRSSASPPSSIPKPWTGSISPPTTSLLRTQSTGP